MELKAGYKRSDLGLIPEDWDAVSMDQVSQCLIGLTYSPLNVSDFGTLVLRSSNIQDGRLAFDDCVFVNMDVPKRAITQKNDILICVRNGSRQLIGKCALIDERTAGSAFGAFMSVLRSESARFLFFQFQSDLLKKQINEVMGATINQITNRDMASFKVIWPSTNAEKEAIAEALSDADALIESLDQLVAKKRQIKQGAMQELLTGKRRLSGFSGEWVLKRLGEIANIKTGARNNQDKVEDGAYPFFVRSSTVERINSFSYDCEAILIPGEGGIGNIFHYVFGKFDVHQRVYAITRFSSETSGKFVYFYMATKFGAHAMENSVKATVDSLRLPTFLDFEITMPPTFDEQAAIAAVLSDMDTELAALESRLAKARQIKQGMMQELLTGRIRLL